MSVPHTEDLKVLSTLVQSVKSLYLFLPNNNLLFYQLESFLNFSLSFDSFLELDTEAGPSLVCLGKLLDPLSLVKMALGILSLGSGASGHVRDVHDGLTHGVIELELLLMAANSSHEV